MTYIHVSKSQHRVFLEHIPGYGSIALSPDLALSILRQLEERRLDIFNMVLDGKDAKYDCADCGGVHQVGTPCPSLKVR